MVNPEIPSDVLDSSARIKRIIWHWTAGTHRVNATDRKHYHLIYSASGKRYIGNYTLRDQNSTKNGYAQHTKNTNTGAAGLALAGMKGANPKGPYGKSPIRDAQIEALIDDTAQLCLFYNIRVTTKTCLSHAEVQNNLGIKQNGKWDFTVLPTKPDLKSAREIGDYLRKRVRTRMKELRDGATPESKKPDSMFSAPTRPAPIVAKKDEDRSNHKHRDTIHTNSTLSWIIRSDFPSIAEDINLHFGNYKWTTIRKGVRLVQARLGTTPDGLWGVRTQAAYNRYRQVPATPTVAKASPVQAAKSPVELPTQENWIGTIPETDPKSTETVKKETNIMDGYKTYLVMAIVAIIAIAEGWLGLDIPGAEMQENWLEMILAAAGVGGMRSAIAKLINSWAMR